MAKLGFISAEFPADSLGGALDLIVQAGGASVQLDLSSAQAETFPEALAPQAAEDICRQFSERGLEIAALSGTYNMVHPDPAVREAGAEDLERLLEIAPSIGAPVVTLCTGSRDPHNMWRAHPENNEPAAWSDLLAQLERALAVAERKGVVLGVEPEIANTVNSIEKARRLLDEVRSPYLKIVMDGANIFQKGQLPSMRKVLDEAFEMLGSNIVLAHAKDLDRDGDAGHLPPGLGKLDYPYYLQLLQDSGFAGSIILHSLTPEQAPGRAEFVRGAAPPGYLEGRSAQLPRSP
jgi:sugar phosphate isomerase/epimerase